MAFASRLVLNTWLILLPTGAVTVTEFRPPGCPARCLCGVGTSLSPLPVKGYFPTVSCSNRKLTEFPGNVPAEARILVLRGNGLKSARLDGSSLPPSVSELDLSYNVIDEVEIASTSPALRHLNLEHNVIGRLTSSSFVQLPQLQVLLLDYNRITRVDPEWMRPLVHLRWLSLSGNRLSALTSDAFDDLHPQLVHLDLSHNKIDGVPDHVLTGLESLRTLDLSHNRVNNLSGQSFAGLEAVERLDLSGNEFDRIPTEALKVFRRLAALVLDDNPLACVSSRQITGFSARLVSISHMPRLRYVDPEAFFDVRGLTAVALHDNAVLDYVSDRLVGPQATAASIVDVQLHRCQLTVIGNLTRTLSGLRQLTLNENPLRCHCLNDWIQETATACTYMLQAVGVACAYTVPEVLSNETRLRVVLALDSNRTADYLPCADVDQRPSPRYATLEPDSVISRHGLLPVITQSATVSGIFSTNTASQSDLNVGSRNSRYFASDTPSPTGGFTIPEVENATMSPTLSCGGATVLLSDEFLYSAIGSVVEFNCRAVGTTAIYWILPGQKIVSKTPNHSRLRLSEAGSLSIDHIKSTDAGRYTCRATSGSSDDVMRPTTARLMVFNADARLLVQRVGSDFVSVTWQGIGSTISSTQYVVLYRQRNKRTPTASTTSETPCRDDVIDDCQLELNPVATAWPQEPRDLCTGPTGSSFPAACFRRVDVRAYMRSYWVGGLEPERLYEFCVGYVRAVDGWAVTLHCGMVRTLTPRHRERHHAPALATVFVVLLIIAPCFFCLVTALVRRYRHRKQYYEPTVGSRVRRTLDVRLGSTDCAGSEDGGRAAENSAERVGVVRSDQCWRHHPAERTRLRSDGGNITSARPIPLDCLCDLPSTSLSATTSQTSLITHA